MSFLGAVQYHDDGAPVVGECVHHVDNGRPQALRAHGLGKEACRATYSSKSGGYLIISGRYFEISGGYSGTIGISQRGQ